MRQFVTAGGCSGFDRERATPEQVMKQMCVCVCACVFVRTCACACACCVPRHYFPIDSGFEGPAGNNPTPPFNGRRSKSRNTYG